MTNKNYITNRLPEYVEPIINLLENSEFVKWSFRVKFRAHSGKSIVKIDCKSAFVKVLFVKDDLADFITLRLFNTKNPDDREPVFERIVKLNEEGQKTLRNLTISKIIPSFVFGAQA